MQLSALQAQLLSAAQAAQSRMPCSIYSLALRLLLYNPYGGIPVLAVA